MTIRVDIHPDVRSKYVVTVTDPDQPDRDILLSSTSQGYENVDNPAAMVRRLFAGPHPVALAFGDAGAHFVEPGDPAAFYTQPADTYAAAGGGIPEPVELYITYNNGKIVGPERLR